MHWNTIWEEVKAKAKRALEDEEKSAIYARRKRIGSHQGQAVVSSVFLARVGEGSHGIWDCGVSSQSTDLP